MVEDDGPGFDVEEALNQPPGKRRLGIFGMQDRARLAGERLASRVNQGLKQPCSCGYRCFENGGQVSRAVCKVCLLFQTEAESNFGG